MSLLLAITVLVIAAAAFFLYDRNGNKNGPPGPRGLPFIGLILSMELVRKERTLLKWARQYGPIFQYSIFAKPTVVLSDPELIRDAFSRAAVAHRPSEKVFELFYADKGMVFSSGEVWQETRRLTLRFLRDQGMGGARLEAVVTDQVQKLMDDVLAANEGRPVSIDRSLRTAVANIIWGTVSSQQFDITDTRALSVMDPIDNTVKFTPLLLLCTLFPVLMRLPTWLTGLNKVQKMFQEPLDALLRPAIVEHKRTIDWTEEPRDYIDCLLQEQRRRPELFTEKHLLRSILDLFMAGYDTTTSMLRWVFCFMCAHTAVQRRLRQEIVSVVGGERPPTLADRPRLPYTEAVLMESQRLANIAPFGIEHRTVEPLQLGGYTVPAGFQVVALLMAVHNDSTLFPEPDQFRPERFLDSDGKVSANKALLPFSVGRRACMGEGLARAELFLFVTSMLQRYSMRFPDGFKHDMKCTEYKFLIREPTPFELVLVKE